MKDIAEFINETLQDNIINWVQQYIDKLPFNIKVKGKTYNISYLELQSQNEYIVKLYACEDSEHADDDTWVCTLEKNQLEHLFKSGSTFGYTKSSYGGDTMIKLI